MFVHSGSMELIPKNSVFYITEFRAFWQAGQAEIMHRMVHPFPLIPKGKPPRKRLILTLFR
jgi:hypothetical protein